MIPDAEESKRILEHYINVGFYSNYSICDGAICEKVFAKFDEINISYTRAGTNENTVNLTAVFGVTGINRVIRLPDAYLLGFGKAATTTFYRALSKLLSVQLLSKDFCVNYHNFRKLYNGLNVLTSYAKSSGLLFSTCMNKDFFLDEVRLFPHARRKAFYLIRDVPNFIYAGYNFWCNKIDVQCCPGDWVRNLPTAYRTPHHFHSIVEGEIRSAFSILGLTSWNYKTEIEPIISRISLANVLVLKSETISTREFWDSFLTFLGITFDRKDLLESFSHRHYNSNARPGSLEFSSADHNRSYSPMLSETLELILSYFSPARIFLQKQFNLTYMSKEKVN